MNYICSIRNGTSDWEGWNNSLNGPIIIRARNWHISKIKNKFVVFISLISMSKDCCKAIERTIRAGILVSHIFQCKTPPNVLGLSGRGSFVHRCCLKPLQIRYSYYWANHSDLLWFSVTSAVIFWGGTVVRSLLRILLKLLKCHYIGSFLR